MASAISAQSDTLVEIVEINKKKYISHTVEKGNTLYAISKRYNTPIDVIKKSNPGLENGLSIGQRILVPLKRDAKEAINNQQVEIDGNYLIHEVRQGETAYGIAKMYDIKFGDIQAENPELDNGLSIGQKLRIPIAKIQKKNEDDVKPAVVKDAVPHTVLKGETLYGLSKKYGVAVEEIQKLNEGKLAGGLREGQSILIPHKKIKAGNPLVNTKLDSAIETSFKPELKKKYTVAVLLPFYYYKNKLMEEKRKASEKPTVYVRSRAAVEFLSGLGYAADSLNRKGAEIELKVYDTANDTGKVKKLIRSGQLQYVDMIIGPFYPRNFDLIADYSKEKGIKLIAPVPQSNKSLLGNPHMVKVATSKILQMQMAAQFVADSFVDENILIVRTKKADEVQLADAFKKNLKSILASMGRDSMLRNVQEVEWTGSRYAFGAVKGKIRGDKRNLIFVPSNNLSFITDMMTKLSKDFDEEQVTLVGMENWTKFDNIDMDYYHILNVHLTTYLHPKTDHPDYQRIVRDFHEEERHPTKYTLLGADVGLYFFSMLQNYGVGFQELLANNPRTGMISDFTFFKTGLESGYENKSCNLLRYKDFVLEKVK